MGRTVVVNQYYIVIGSKCPVLECIIKDNQVRRGYFSVGALTCPLVCLQLFRVAQQVATLYPVAVDCDSYSREFLLYLEGLVTIFLDRSVPRDDLETAASAPVAPREDSAQSSLFSRVRRIISVWGVLPVPPAVMFPTQIVGTSQVLTLRIP